MHPDGLTVLFSDSSRFALSSQNHGSPSLSVLTCNVKNQKSDPAIDIGNNLEELLKQE
jgi:hypothetical protein